MHKETNSFISLDFYFPMIYTWEQRQLVASIYSLVNDL